MDFSVKCTKKWKNDIKIENNLKIQNKLTSHPDSKIHNSKISNKISMV